MSRSLRNTKRPRALEVNGFAVCTGCGRAGAPGKLVHEVLCSDPNEVVLDAPAPANSNAPAADSGSGRVDMAALLVEQIDRFSLGERLRLAAHLLDDVKAGHVDRVRLVQHARHITRLVDKELLAMLREYAE